MTISQKMSDLPTLGIQALLSVMLVGTCSFLWATGQVVPNDLLLLTGVVVSHWMGRKSAEASQEKVPPVYIPGEA